MLSASARQAARWLAVVLIGAGIGGAAVLGGFAALAAVVGALLAINGLFVLLWTLSRWNRTALDSWRGKPFTGHELLTPRLFGWIDLAYLGVGLLVGSWLPGSALLVAAGVAGAVAILVSRSADI